MITNLVPSKKPERRNAKMEITKKYVYLDHKIRISRNSQITEMQQRTTSGCLRFIERSLQESIQIEKLKFQLM